MRRGSSRSVRCQSSRSTASAGPETVASATGSGPVPSPARTHRPPSSGASASAAGSGAVRPSRTWRGNITVTTSSMPSRANAGSIRSVTPASCACRTVSCAWRRNQNPAMCGSEAMVQQGAAGPVDRSVSISDPAPTRNQSTSWSRSTGASSNVFWPERLSATAVRAQRWTPPRWRPRSVNDQPGQAGIRASRSPVRRRTAKASDARPRRARWSSGVSGVKATPQSAPRGRPMSAVRRRRPRGCPAVPARARTA